ncbi:hypothetical protein [Metaclostridioides mangenotii]|uniref:Uncharacterized protein n=1 Tax=Metaclostridioides mangenotii TaxID=1540 RepID=A0ABS4EBT5_9FIRM|nr:hypothetical protein [Clostridioides mangenotii]MBP1855407.1 hypothetical protein [Clostridioides mangenotii]
MAKKAELEKKDTVGIARFSKEQLINSEKYAAKRDLLTALLDADKEYSFLEVDKEIDKFEKKVM